MLLSKLKVRNYSLPFKGKLLLFSIVISSSAIALTLAQVLLIEYNGCRKSKISFKLVLYVFIPQRLTCLIGAMLSFYIITHFYVIRGGGELFKYPWTVFSKLQQFPYKFYWEHGRAFRYFIYSSILLVPVYYKLQQLSNSPANVKKWEEIRASRHHTYFDLPHDH
ncbi:hypothetical protein Btru_055838 [Bulinus truncatus]|nr:hypothetical protein Btru_055838 [Bulinus truncatus]